MWVRSTEGTLIQGSAITLKSGAVKFLMREEPEVLRFAEQP